MNDAQQQPIPAPVCSHCGFTLPKHDGGLRHYGTHTAHQEWECLRLLHAEIARLRDDVAAITGLQDEVAELRRMVAWHEDRKRDVMTAITMRMPDSYCTNLRPCGSKE